MKPWKFTNETRKCLLGAETPRFYKSSILYLAFTPLDAIPVSERPQIAFETVVAALVAEEDQRKPWKTC